MARTIGWRELGLNFFLNASSDSNVSVHREQFPICLAYAVTIHKSQGMTLERVIADLGSAVFGKGMIYVAMSRVKTMKGLTLLNFDRNKLKANVGTILEYNRLRSTIGLENLPTPKPVFKKQGHVDKKYFKPPARELPREIVDTTQIPPGFRRDGYRCYANSLLSILFNLPQFRDSIEPVSGTNHLKNLLISYLTNEFPILDTLSVREDAHLIDFTSNCFEDPFWFLRNLIRYKYHELGKACEMKIEFDLKCDHCGQSKLETVVKKVIELKMKDKSISIKELFENALNEKTNCTHCLTPESLTTKRKFIRTSKYLFVTLQNQQRVGIAGTNTPLALNVNGKTVKYKLVGTMVFHPRKQHFISLIKNDKKMYKHDDDIVEILKRWPQNSIVQGNPQKNGNKKGMNNPVDKFSPYGLFFARV